MNEHRIRVLIADDHYVVRVGLTGILNLQPEFLVVAEAEDGTSALAAFRQHRPDVTLMDLRMPGMSGLEATVAIRREFPQARIIALTTFDREEDIYRTLEAGACGYLSKRIPGAELITAIKAVYSGQSYLPPEVAQRLAERQPSSKLTPREIEVLEFMAKGLNNREIGSLMGITRFTAKFHVQNILQKIGACDRTEAVAAAIQRGVLRSE